MTKPETAALIECGGWGTLEFRNEEGRQCHACREYKHMVFMTSCILVDALYGTYIAPEICMDCWWKLTPEAVGLVVNQLRQATRRLAEMQVES